MTENQWLGGPRKSAELARRTPNTRRPVVPVAAGDPFSAGERAALDAAIRKAEQLSRAEFSVFVGKAEGEARAFATRLHNSLVAPARAS